MNDNTKRLFIGCSIAPCTISAWQKTLQTQPTAPAKNSRWTKPENAHLTLFFLGNTPAELTPSINEQMKNRLQNSPSFTTEAIKIDHFPGPKGKTIATFLRLNRELAQLYNTIRSGLKPLGITPNHKSFLPHITLVHLNKPLTTPITSITLPSTPQIEIKEVTLYESTSTTDGSCYNPLARFRLNDNS